MQIQFVDQDKARTKLLPLTYTRPIADLRVGILRISEKWSKMLEASSYGYDTAAYLSLKFSLAQNPTIFIYNGLLPNLQLLADITSLPAQTKLVANGKVLVSNAPIDRCDYTIEYLGEINQIVYPWDIFSQNGSEINKDFELLTANRKSEQITDPHTICYGENIFLEKGAKVKAAILNAENGPIYLGKDTEISEGAIVKGPFAFESRWRNIQLRHPRLYQQRA
jgi:hypothetical protein